MDLAYRLKSSPTNGFGGISRVARAHQRSQAGAMDCFWIVLHGYAVIKVPGRASLDKAEWRLLRPSPFHPDLINLLSMTKTAPKNGLRPVHPGEVLREEYLKPLGLSANALSVALRVPASRINDIVLERRGVTVDTAMRLTRYFGGDVQSWINLQSAYDLKIAARTLARRVEREVQPMPA